ncbi:hypothetical protein HGB13_01705 [bacterium]|nr:hypothetical protein [bacterium]
MSQMFTHCGYCGSRFYLASPTNWYPKVLDLPVCDSCLDRFKVFPKLPEVLKSLRGFEREWFLAQYPHDGQRLYDAWNRFESLNYEIKNNLKEARNREIFRRLRKLYRGTSVTLDGVKVILRNLNYESVGTVSNTMAYWGGSDDWRRWLRDHISTECFVVRYKGRIVGYVENRKDEWVATTDLNIVWWAWTKRSSRDDAIRVLLAAAKLISLSGNEECMEAIWKKEVNAHKAAS